METELEMYLAQNLWSPSVYLTHVQLLEAASARHTSSAGRLNYVSAVL